jgi:PadR family transcriptional regulator PadR
MKLTAPKDPWPFRKTAAIQTVLAVFSKRPEAELYGYEICQVTGLKSGTVYPILNRLVDAGWAKARVEPRVKNLDRPPRTYYRLTDMGRRRVASGIGKPPVTTGPRQFRQTIAVAIVLAIFLQDPGVARYGREISYLSSLAPGTVHLVLGRLADAGWLEARPEEVNHDNPGHPPRIYYRLTAEGRRQSPEYVKRSRKQIDLLREIADEYGE